MKSKYPENWGDLRKQAKIRDGHKCVICGYTKNLIVHHTREKAILKDLITLCKRCHNCFVCSSRGFKKKIKIFNDLRFNENAPEIEVEEYYNNLIEEINSYVERYNKVDKLKFTNNKGKEIIIKKKKLLPITFLKEEQLTFEEV